MLLGQKILNFVNLLSVYSVYICETGFDPDMKEVRIWMNLRNCWLT